MVVDTFLAMRDEDLSEFTEMYQDFKVPFWMNTRAETVNEWRGEQLERMGIIEIFVSELDTAAHTTMFYSHRIQGKRAGRQGLIACMV